MAKEQKEHTTIGFSRSTIATILLVVSVIGALAFWKDRGRAEAASTVTKDIMLQSHEGRLSKAENDIGDLREDQTDFEDEVKERFVGNEKTAIRLENAQQAILTNQTDFKIQQRRHTDLIMEQMKLQAETNAWIRKIEKVE